MPDAASDTVSRVLGELLRAPEPVPDIDVGRALQRLQAARSDTPYLLLHRVLVLEAALQQLRPAAGPGAPAATTVQGPAVTARAAPSRSFLRDAAVVALGVAAGSAVADTLAGGEDSGAGGLFDAGTLGSLLD